MMVTQGHGETGELRLQLMEYYADGSKTGMAEDIHISVPETLDPSNEWLKAVLVEVIEHL